jgi:hypothetical protein
MGTPASRTQRERYMIGFRVADTREFLCRVLRQRAGIQNLFAALRVHTGEVSAMARQDAQPFRPAPFPRPARGRDPRLPRGHRDQRQPLHPDDLGGERLARRPSALALRLHAQARELAQPGRDLLFHPRPPPAQTPWFTSESDLAQQMLAFVETYNQTARPFNWTYTGKVLAA